MLIIRHAQLEVLARARRRECLAQLCGHLRQHFASELRTLGNHALRRQVYLAMRRAEHYGLCSPRDYGRFLNLAVVYGWEFDLSPQHAWMRNVLCDPLVSGAGQRLGRLIDQCAEREMIARHNRHLRQSWREGARV